MRHTRDIDRLVAALVDLTGFLSSPQRDEVLLREAGVSIDRALFPLLVRLERSGALSVAALADQVGRDHTTVSRQLAKLESLELICRWNGGDRRVRAANLTAAGAKTVRAITAARRRLLSRALDDWSEADRAALASLSQRFVDAIAGGARERRDPAQVGAL